MGGVPLAGAADGLRQRAEGQLQQLLDGLADPADRQAESVPTQLLLILQRWGPGMGGSLLTRLLLHLVPGARIGQLGDRHLVFGGDLGIDHMLAELQLNKTKTGGPAGLL